MSAHEAMRRIESQLTHIWMVRTFIKHSEEAEEDEELMEVVRTLYDCTLAVGPASSADDAAEYLKIARKKLPRLRQALEQFRELQPQVSDHTNFKMALASLSTAISDIGQVLDQAT